jgi:simple sugar transport system ATP-binding protein
MLQAALLNGERGPGDVAVQMSGISKRFGPVQALHNVDLELRHGEILGLVGDNGAGKSTLMKILNGAVIPDDGQILVDGVVRHIRSPRDAWSVGISTIYQELALFNNLDVAANVFSGRELTTRVLGIRFLRRRRMEKEAGNLLRELNISLASPRLLVERLSGGQRQMMAAARAIGFKSRVLILDEPTAALGVRESAVLLEHVTRLREAGLGIIMVTHRIPDVLAIGDRVMILKGGESQGVLSVDSCTLNDVVGLIVGGKPRD